MDVHTHAIDDHLPELSQARPLDHWPGIEPTTIERGTLWMLQTRVGKRTAAAAFRIVSQLVDENLITMDEALSRLSGSQLALLMFPQFDRSAPREPLTTGTAASPGAAGGSAIFDPATAKARRAALTAHRIADAADLFSFGTNDLTQTAWVLSRDDVESSFFAAYLAKSVFTVSPFETIDGDGVGRFVQLAAEAGRRPNRFSSLGSAASTAAIPNPSIFSPAGTTCPAPRSGSRSPALKQVAPPSRKACPEKGVR